MAKPVTKPRPGAAKAPAPKPKPKAKAKPAATAKPAKFEKGVFATFAGYATEHKKPYLQAGESVYVHDVIDNEGAWNYVVVKAEHADAAKADPNLVKVDAEQLIGKELKAAKQPPKPEVRALVLPMLAKQLKGTDAVALATQLYEDRNRTTFFLGGALSIIYQDKLFTEKEHGGYSDDREGFEKFLDEKIGMSSGGGGGSYRKAMEIMSIYKRFSLVPHLDMKKLDEIGWSKASVLSGYLPVGNNSEATAEEIDAAADKLIEMAGENDIVTLKAALKTEYVDAETGRKPGGGKTHAGTVKKVTFGPFKLFQDQAQVVTTIFKAAEKSLAIKDMNQLFEHIVTVWGNEHLEPATKAKLKAMVAKPAVAPKPATPPAKTVAKPVVRRPGARPVAKAA